MFRTILIANRGEIARRVIRTCRRMGIRTVAVYSEADVDAPHVVEADAAALIGPPPARESYLVIEHIIEAARTHGAEAIHPGYGFLSENAAFARACAEAGLQFIGPTVTSMEVMGDKAAAKSQLAASNVPMLPGRDLTGLDDAQCLAACDDVGYPLLLKAAAGGGGKGMRSVQSPAELDEAMAAARREATSAFGDQRLLAERLLLRPRHIEVQVFGDTHGNLVHLFERECSIQRRHQKVIEEAPSAAVGDGLRARMTEAALEVARAVDYVGAGTVEFLVDATDGMDDDSDFFFLEMNTRLQVEHAVTELVTGFDLVEWQLRVAAGEALPAAQDGITLDGHAIEARIYAEAPELDHLPQTGLLRDVHYPVLDGVRVDAGAAAGDAITRFYDPMMAKVCGHGATREIATDRLLGAMRATSVLGVRTNVRHLADVVGLAEFAAGDLHTSFLDEHARALEPAPDDPVDAAIAAVLQLRAAGVNRAAATSALTQLGPWRARGQGGWRTRVLQGDEEVGAEVVADAGGWAVSIGDQRMQITVEDGGVLPGGAGVADMEIDGRAESVRHAVDGETVWLHREGRIRTVEVLTATHRRDADAIAGQRSFVAPMPGAVIEVRVEVGDRVAPNEVMAIVEAMKMEHPVTSPAAGRVTAVHVTAGEAVDANQPLLELEPDD